MPLVRAILLWAAALGPAAAATDHAVILLYHHVSGDTPASTSVTPERFERHLAFLADHGYRIWSLRRTLEAVHDPDRDVPPDVVSITFDDAYESVFTEAFPRLRARDWPFTVFVNTDAVDAGHDPYMDWNQLRRLAEAGVAIGSHSAAHGHMAAPADGESRKAWRRRVGEDLERAHRRIAAATGIEPFVFAYPYGEDSPALADMVAERYRYALVQRSGAFGPMTPPLAVPRFPMATGFSSLDRLALAVDARPLPVGRVESGPTEGNPDRIRLFVRAEGFSVDRLRCFSASGRPLDLERRDDGDGMRVEVDIAGIGKPGRNKVNCTAPASDGSGAFYWYAWQWILD